MPDPSISLCLSGGGYRAAIFHLGVLQWLNQCGALPRLEEVSCVSGGSIIGAHLARCLRPWPTEPLPDADWNAHVVQPFREFVKHDIRTGPVLKRGLPWNWARSTSTGEALEKNYEKHLFGKTDPALTTLPATPQFVFCATDMVFGVNWEATRVRVGSYEAGYASPPPPKWTLARAVAASSCFPPVFPPVKSGLDPEEYKGGAYREHDRDQQLKAMRLTDGGVYDNLGLQPVMRNQAIICSDGGGQMEFVRLNLPWRRLARYPALLQSGIGKLRRSWLVMDFMRPDDDPSKKAGTICDISGENPGGTAVESKSIAELITSIRTDLNAFTDAEFEILVNHGYLRAVDKTLGKCPELLPNAPANVQPPFGGWEDPAKIEKALRLSEKRFVVFRERRSR